MKDNFSKQALDYSKFRPHYPGAMINRILSLVSGRQLALDVATGNGQLAVLLAPHFSQVFATDISTAQLAHAQTAANITYLKATAENMGFEDKQFDLVTVAQAVHWFDFDAFYKEVYRILKPDGLFVVMGYGVFSSNPESDAILMDYYHNIVGPYWDRERKYIDDNCQTIPFPFDEIAVEKFSNQLTWTFDQLTGYLETWSATQHYKNKHLQNPVDLIREALLKSWENSNKQVTFPLLMRVGKLKKHL